MAVQMTLAQDTGKLEHYLTVEYECVKWKVCTAHLVAQLEALTGSGQVEIQEKPTSMPRNGLDLIAMPT